MNSSKGIGPVVATSLFLVVAVVAVFGFQTWWNTYSSGIFSDAENESTSTITTKIESIVGDQLYFYNGDESNLSIQRVSVEGVNCNISRNATAGMNTIWLDSCISDIGSQEFVIVTNAGIFSKEINVKTLPSVQATLDLRFDLLSGGLSWPLNVSFTRATNATYLDSDGLLKRAPHNMLNYSEEFDNAIWSNTGAVVEADQALAPDGSMTADIVYDDNSGSYETIYQDVMVEGDNTTNRTLSVYMKNINTSRVQVVLYHLESPGYASGPVSYVYINTTDFSEDGYSGNYTINSVGDDWYRVSTTLTNNYSLNDKARIHFYPAHNGASATGAIYLWGAQLERNPTASFYLQTQDGENYSGPRVEYDNSGNSLGLLVEEQRTNHITESQDFGGSGWTRTTVNVQANATTDPMGSKRADKLYDDSSGAGNEHRVEFSSSYTAVANYTLSVFAKAAEYDDMILRLVGDDGSNEVYCTLSGEGSVSTPANNGAATDANAWIEKIGNDGWYRCILSGTPGSSGNMKVWIGTASAVATPNHAGDGTSGLYIWGAQLENGTFPTSYIPTEGSEQTRNADSPVVSEISWLTDGKGTFLVESSIPYQDTGSYPYIFQLDNGTDAGRISVYVDGAGGNAYYYIQDSGGPQTNTNLGTYDFGISNKIAYAYKSNDISASIDGSAVVTDTSATIPNQSMSRVTIGYHLTNQHLNGYVKRLTYWPERFTDSRIRTLTN